MVATHPPWSTAMSTITEPSFICETISLVTRTGARAPARSTAPISRSARRTTCSMLKLFDIKVTTWPRKRSSTWRSRSTFTSRIDTSAPSPTAGLTALSPAAPAPRRTTPPGAAPDVVDRGELGADRGVLLVTDPASCSGAALDEHGVRSLDHGPGAGRRERHALLARLDLAGNPDDHRASFAEVRRAARKSRISRFPRSGCSCTTQCQPSGLRSDGRAGP